jgi:hypothetical protein
MIKFVEKKCTGRAPCGVWLAPTRGLYRGHRTGALRRGACVDSRHASHPYFRYRPFFCYPFPRTWRDRCWRGVGLAPIRAPQSLFLVVVAGASSVRMEVHDGLDALKELF